VKTDIYLFNYIFFLLQIASMSILECNITVQTSMTWFAYKVNLVKNPESETGLIEQLTEIRINDTVPTYTSSMITIPPLTLDYGLHKLEFQLEIETGVPELPLYNKAFTYVNIAKTPLVPGFIKGSVAKVTRGWGQVIKLDGSKFSTDPDSPQDNNFNYTWWCRRLDGPEGPEQFNYELIDSDNDKVAEEFPIFKSSELQRIPGARDPIIINPPKGCFGNGPGPMKVSGARLSLNTSSFVTYAQLYEISLVVMKDSRVSQVKIMVDIGVIPAPIIEIECATEGLCFPTFGGIFINPTSRLAMRSACIESCEGGEITFNWNLIHCNPLNKIQPPWCPMQLRTLSCNLDLMTTTSTTTTTTTTESTTTLPPEITITSTTFTEDSTEVAYTAASSNGSIIVSYDDGTADRKKRQISIELGETGLAVKKEDDGPVELIPKQIPQGCTSVFTAGLTQSEFTLSTEFFSMNPQLREFEIELNITRCITTPRKVVCASGISTVAVKVNDPPALGTCTINNLGKTKIMDFVNPGFNTALLDIFDIRCQFWNDPNDHAITKYVFKS